MNDGSKLALTLVLAIVAVHFLLGGRGSLIWTALTGPGDPLGAAFHLNNGSAIGALAGAAEGAQTSGASHSALGV